jgi:predicted DsbA family dithiol-disulfide isomerase
MAPIRLDIVSDTICPWCYLGKRRLEAALARRPDVQVEIRWHPYQLDPSLPPEGAPHRERLAAKFGSAARLDAAHARLRELGAPLGLKYEFDRIPRTPDTTATHAMARWAYAQGGAPLQGQLIDRVFRAFFEEGADLTDTEVLVRLAGEAGLDEADVRDKLAARADFDTVRAEADGWRRSGVDGVPTFVFAERWAVSGAQEVDTFLRVIDQVVESLATSTTASTPSSATPSSAPTSPAK